MSKFKQTEIGLIPEDWDFVNIEYNLEKIIDYRGKTPKKSETGIKTLSARSIKNGKIDYNNTYCISENTFKEWQKRGIPEVGDVLVTTEGPLGEVAQYNKKDVAIAQRLLCVRGKKTRLDNCYLMYYFLSEIGQSELFSRASGTTVQGIKQSEFRKINIILPPLPEQKAIAKILSDLDSKIELNQQMNKTLEEIGRTLFKRWFVDFEFPNEQGNPYKSSGGEMVYNEELKKEIPKGWEIKTLESIINRNKQKIDEKQNWENENMIDLSNMPQFNISLENYQKGGTFVSNIFKLNEFDILFGSIRPYFGKAGFSPITGVVTGTVYSYLPKENTHYSFVLFLTTSTEFIDFTIRYSKGTKMPIIGWSDFGSYKIAIPKNKDLLNKFNDEIINFIYLIKNNICENHKLAEIRDLLLPKLMSGKIRVKY